MKPSGYGKERYHFDGASLPSLIRAVCASSPDGQRNQQPIVKFTGVTRKVRLKRALALVRKVAK